MCGVVYILLYYVLYQSSLWLPDFNKLLVLSCLGLSGSVVCHINEFLLRREQFVLWCMVVIWVQIPCKCYDIYLVMQPYLSCYVTSHPVQLSLAILPFKNSKVNTCIWVWPPRLSQKNWIRHCVWENNSLKIFLRANVIFMTPVNVNGAIPLHAQGNSPYSCLWRSFQYHGQTYQATSWGTELLFSTALRIKRYTKQRLLYFTIRAPVHDDELDVNVFAILV